MVGYLLFFYNLRSAYEVHKHVSLSVEAKRNTTELSRARVNSLGKNRHPIMGNIRLLGKEFITFKSLLLRVNTAQMMSEMQKCFMRKFLCKTNLCKKPNTGFILKII